MQQLTETPRSPDPAIGGLLADLEKLPPIFSTRALADWSQGAWTERRLIDFRRDGTGPTFFRPDGSRQVLYTRAAVAAWLTANHRTRTAAA